MTEEKRYKDVQSEYFKKKQPTVDALKKLSVNDLCSHIKAYKEYMLSLVMDHAPLTYDVQLQKQIEKQLQLIDQLENFLDKDLNQYLMHIMLDEDIIRHFIKKMDEDQQIGASCKTPF